MKFNDLFNIWPICVGKSGIFFTEFSKYLLKLVFLALNLHIRVQIKFNMCIYILRFLDCLWFEKQFIFISRFGLIRYFFTNCIQNGHCFCAACLLPLLRIKFHFYMLILEIKHSHIFLLFYFSFFSIL